MRGWFRFLRRRRLRPAPQPKPQLSVGDAINISKAGLTRAQWEALTNKERADIRWRVGA